MDAIPLSDLDREIIQCLGSSHGLVREASSNAVAHLQKAWHLRELDPQMAVFRGITAEEEAATAIIACLQELRYRNAEKLRRRDHIHKLGVYPFFTIINNHLSVMRPRPEFRFKIKEIRPHHPQLTIHVRSHGDWGEPVPPLHFSILEAFPTNETLSADGMTMTFELQSGLPYNFRREIQDFLELNGLARYRAHLKEVAQLRNRLLYASYDGGPEVIDDVSAKLLAFRDHVFVLLQALCLIFPHLQHALFVQQAIDVFLAAVEGMDYEALLKSDPPPNSTAPADQKASLPGR